MALAVTLNSSNLHKWPLATALNSFKSDPWPVAATRNTFKQNPLPLAATLSSFELTGALGFELLDLFASPSKQVKPGGNT